MALAILVLLTTLFFMVFFSIYIRHFAGSDDDRRRRNPSLSSSSSSAHRQLTESMASSSSSYASDSQNCTRWNYHVFLSFRGEDTRKTFTSHLYEGLKNRAIETFQDDKRLEKGDSIPEELLKAIEESQVALVIFSKNYATSRWCLNELVKIMECKEVKKQIVIPVFYDVDPSDVRYQTGKFEDAFSKHESRYKDDVDGMQMVQGWRTALSAAANLSGCNVHDRIESVCIRELVDDVSSKLCKTSSSSSEYTVGIDTHLKEVKSLLEMESGDVRILGIWGMGGVGKTTLARAVFDTLSPQFQYASFLEDVKETNINEMHSLQNKLLSELLREDKKYVNNKTEGKRLMAERLRFMKVLVVLDDINHRDHLEYLAGDLDWFGSGSRIIATARDREILGMNNVVVHEVITLLEPDAIQLFNHYAFKGLFSPDEHMKKLALEAVSHAKGLPLALRLWGSWLNNTDKTLWREAVDLIKRESSKDVVNNLKISFEGLQDKEKTIFLDIACFFRGMGKDETIEILESYDLGARIRLHSLIEKSLVFISTYDTIQMHDLIQDMGRYVVTAQKDSGQPSRLWNIEDIEDVMVNKTGTRAVEAIWLSYYQKPSFSKEAMKNMQSLRILRIQSDPFAFPSDSKDDSEDDFIGYLPNNLCWIVWPNYPWKLLPENFNPRRLVHLHLRHNSLRYLWKETKLQQFLSLRRIDLSGSKSLKRTPDFKGMPNLEYLILEYCTSLEEVHPSLKDCKKLIELNLDECASLERFPYVNVESLQSLNLYNCYSLQKFPELILGRMKQGTARKIMTSRSGIRELPLYFLDHQPHLIELDLDGITNLASLPSSICKSKGLVKLHVSNWSKLESLPEDIGDLENLEELDASYTLISRPPSSIVRLNKLKSLSFGQPRSEDGVYFVFPLMNKGLLSLESLDLRGCNLIDGGLPEDIGCLTSLKVLNLSYCNIIDGGLPEDIGSLSSLIKLYLKGNNFEHLPRSISKLGALRSLDLSDCKRLTQLPEDIGCLTSLKELNLRYCNIIDGGLLEDIGCLSSLEELDLSYCNIIDGGLLEDIGFLSSLEGLYLKGNNFEHLPQSISKHGALRHLNLSDCKKLTQLPEFPKQLETITADWSNDLICNSLFQIIPSLQHDICSSDSFSLRLFGSWVSDIPSWFNYKGMGTRVSVDLPENWYVSDNFLGFAVCHSGDYYIDCITAHLIPLSCDDEMSSMTQQFASSNNSQWNMNFLLVPLSGLWDASNANGKTPNDYGCIKLDFIEETLDFIRETDDDFEETDDDFGENMKFGVRLLYKNEFELCIGKRKSRYEEEATCSSSKKLLQLFPTSPGL